MAKLAQRPGVSIVCRQCDTVLYKGNPREHTPGHAMMQWIPQPKGSRKPPAQPPKKCPYCDGPTGQVGMPHES